MIVPTRPRMRVVRPAAPHEAHWQASLDVGVLMLSEAELLEVVLTLRSRGALTDLLHRGNEHRDENADDGDDHEQFDQGKAATKTRHARSPRAHLTIPEEGAEVH